MRTCVCVIMHMRMQSFSHTHAHSVMNVAVRRVHTKNMWPYLEIDSECLLRRMQVGGKLCWFGDALIFTFNTATFLLELVKWYIGTAALAHWSNGDFGHDGSTSRNWAWWHRGQRCGTTIGRNWNVRQFLLLHQAWFWGYWICRSPGLEGYQLLRSHFQKARPKIAKKFNYFMYFDNLDLFDCALLKSTKPKTAFFNVFEKTQARKNSTVQKTQGFFRPKLNKPVVIVAKWISKLIPFSAFLL